MLVASLRRYEGQGERLRQKQGESCRVPRVKLARPAATDASVEAKATTDGKGEDERFGYKVLRLVAVL
jgi:hypothetical protein